MTGVTSTGTGRNGRTPGRQALAATAAAVLTLALAGCGPDGTERPAAWAPAAPSGSATAGAPATPGGGPAGGRSVTVLGAGDILLHPPLWEQARLDGHGTMDFGPLLASARPAISAADLALCHLETPLAPAGGPYAGFPRFSVPPQVVAAIRQAGYDGCSTVSNHSLDQGYAGVLRTLDALDRAGLGHAGTYRTQAESRRPRIYRADGVPVAHLGYTSNLNGLRRPAGKPWVANLISADQIAADAAVARRAGAEIVVVSLHWGTEYLHQPDSAQRELARKVAGMRDVDLVLGHHAHVVQPVERRSGKWIVYGMGNQVARHERPIDANREGAMVRVTFRPAGEPGRWTASAIEAVPTFVELGPPIRLIDLERALADPAVPAARRRVYRAAAVRIGSYLLSGGAARAGLVVRGIDR